MKTNPFFSFFKKPVIIGCSIALVLLLITAQFAYQRYLIQKAEQTKELNREAQDVKEKLQTALNHSLSATKTLSLLVTRYNGERDFDTVAKSILESNKYIDGLELVRAGVITKIYPLQGNEQALGYNILEDTLRNKEAIRAINDNELFFAGPIQLRQGYPAVVGRLPITEQGKFWGFAAVIIKLSTFIKAAEIDSAHNPGFIYQLSKIDPNTGKEVFFLPHAEFFQQGQQVVSTKVSKGNWIIYVRSADSRWPVTLLPIIILGVLLSASGGLLA
ncbi:MAG TPA: CHASE domain-containing protein [Chitinophagaceae bacterium]|nr:CHASE domain-containing protein [Chitinophagaceae bacterium]